MSLQAVKIEAIGQIAEGHGNERSRRLDKLAQVDIRPRAGKPMHAEKEEAEVGSIECLLDLATFDLAGQDLPLVPDLIFVVARPAKAGFEIGEHGLRSRSVVHVVERDEEPNRAAAHSWQATLGNEWLISKNGRLLSRELGDALRGLVVGRSQKPALPLSGL
jgi:hypothetical protein